VFERLIADIARESEARRVLVVSRNESAEYRVRGYLSAHNEGAEGKVAWVFDVFDAGRRRTVRLSGEEPAAAGEAWSSANDGLVSKIAAQSVAELSQWLASTPTRVAGGTAEPGDSPAPRPDVARSADDDGADVAAVGPGPAPAAASYAPH
jgi:hypothetical protein